MDPWKWMEILRECPEKAAECPCWDEFTPMEWMLILKEQPQFAHKCAWEKLSGHDWALVLNFMPEAVKHCRWENLSAQDWSELLRMHPEFADKCQRWNDFSDYDWLFFENSKRFFVRWLYFLRFFTGIIFRKFQYKSLHF